MNDLLNKTARFGTTRLNTIKRVIYGGSVGVTALLSLNIANATLPTIYPLDDSMLQTAESVHDAGIYKPDVKTTPVRMTHSQPIYYGTESEYPFSSAVRVGDTLYMSGQIGVKDGKLVTGGVKAETKQALSNINQTLLQYGYQKADLVKCMAMLTDMDDFGAFNEVYKSELTHPYPVRSAFGVADLALGASVEVECMAVK